MEQTESRKIHYKTISIVFFELFYSFIAELSPSHIIKLYPVFSFTG